MRTAFLSSALCIVAMASLLHGCGSDSGGGGTGGTSGTAGTTGAGGTAGTMGVGGGGRGGTTGAAGTFGVVCTYPEETRCRTELCGNGVRDMCMIALPADCINTTFTEWCDGDALGTASCASRGHGSGTLRCKSDCGFDYSGCTGGTGG